VTRLLTMRRSGSTTCAAATVTVLIALSAIMTTAAAATPRAKPASTRTAAAGPIARTVALLDALKTHRYARACDVYHPLFWSHTGFAPQRCAAVLAQTFPRSAPVAYRVELGGQVSRRGAIVAVSMVLGEDAPLCSRLWASGHRCPKGSTFRFSLMLDELVFDWRHRKVAHPRERWYVYEVGWI
jgi:hypothetical protein